MMRRLAMFDAQTGSDILEDIFIGLERMADWMGPDMNAFNRALYERLKRYEINSKEVYDNFYACLAGKTE